ncbi:MAG: NAD-dependent protein deacylase [Elusimicrobiota bacterium]|jgi:NAD-dependent deacetylase|nr:NAD-dependent protein deacylase [Elusimicrobiota bacterium]
MQNVIDQAIGYIKNSKYAVAFTGAGISVESGIPSFRGKGGVWEKYGEDMFEIDYFNSHKVKCWRLLSMGFYAKTLAASPNPSHNVLAKMEEQGVIKSVITQNIDGLHVKAGSKKVYHLHGQASVLICQTCGNAYEVFKFDLQDGPPRCETCGDILKPNFVFFGENLPEYDIRHATVETVKCDLMLVIGSTGIVYPAASFPAQAKTNGAKIVEINPHRSKFTNTITDMFIQMPASQAFKLIARGLGLQEG